MESLETMQPIKNEKEAIKKALDLNGIALALIDAQNFDHSSEEFKEFEKIALKKIVDMELAKDESEAEKILSETIYKAQITQEEAEKKRLDQLGV